MLPEKHEHHYDQKCKNSIGCLLVIKVALPNIGGGHATMHRLDVHRLQWLITENLRRHAQDLMCIYIYIPLSLYAFWTNWSWSKKSWFKLIETVWTCSHLFGNGTLHCLSLNVRHSTSNPSSPFSKTRKAPHRRQVSSAPQLLQFETKLRLPLPSLMTPQALVEPNQSNCTQNG